MSRRHRMIWNRILPAPFGPIVSSAHLASGASPALSEFEFGLILVEPCLRALDGALHGCGGRERPFAA